MGGKRYLTSNRIFLSCFFITLCLLSEQYLYAEQLSAECKWLLVNATCEYPNPDSVIDWMQDLDQEAAIFDESGPSDSACPAPNADAETIEQVPPLFESLSREGNTIQSQNFSLSVDDFGFPESISVNTQPILSGPLSFTGLQQYLQQENAVKHTSWYADGLGFKWVTVIETESLIYTNTARIGYDRFIHFTITVEPKSNLEISNLAISLPIKRTIAKYISASNEGTEIKRTITDGLDGHYYNLNNSLHLQVSELEEFQWLAFSNILRASDETAGLYLAFESDRFWHDKSNNAFAASVGPQELLLSANFLNQSLITVDRPLLLEFGLGVLPVRNLPGWADLKRFNATQFKDAESVYQRNLFGAQFLPQSLAYQRGLTDISSENSIEDAVLDGLKTIIVHQEWTDMQGYPGASDATKLQALQQLVTDAHQYGVKVVAYLGLELPENSPEWLSLGEELARLPIIEGRSRGDIRAIRPNAGNTCYKQFLLAHLTNLIEITNIDGVFLDLIPDAEVDANYKAGQGYVDNQGRLRGEKRLFASRQLVKEIYELFHGGVKNDGIVVGHVTGLFSPAYVFTDYLLTGEIQVKRAKNNPELSVRELYSEEMLRSSALLQANGIPLFWLTKEDAGSPGVRENRSIFLPHGILQRTQWPHFIAATSDRTMMNSTEEIFEEWEIWKKVSELSADDTTFFPYWRNGEYMQINSLQGALVSFWAAPGSEVLLAIGNPTDQPISGNIKLDMQKLGFNGPDNVYKDFLDNQILTGQSDGSLEILLLPTTARIISVIGVDNEW